MYMGFDFSTQQVKSIIIDEQSNIVREDQIRLDDLGYKTEGGVRRHSDGLTVTAPTLMWVQALDELLCNIYKNDCDILSQVKSIGGCGQQHGSVYWRHGADETLSQLKSTLTLKEQLSASFSVADSPLWMDSSTSKQCDELEAAVGGKQNMAAITGSKAYERFTGSQILKLITNRPDLYKDTARVSLVSSFACSLFLGHIAHIDESDGSGMNLYDINKRQWCSELIQACSDDLSDKLGKVLPTATIQGRISGYYCERYNFNSDCTVCTFTGDNPASLAGLRLAPGDVAVSLGSSDTVFLWISEPQPSTEGTVLVNPVSTNDYLAMLVFKNGSFTREFIRNRYSTSDWSEFNKQLHATQPGNSGCIGFYFTECEIAPSNITGCYYFNGHDEKVDDLDKGQHARAVLEGQFLSRRVYAERMGFKLGSECRVLATGGASSNPAILQILSDTFSAPVYTLDVPNSAALGGAYLARHAFSSDGQSFHERLNTLTGYKLATAPNTQYKQVYDEMAIRYIKLEERVIQIFSSN